MRTRLLVAICVLAFSWPALAQHVSAASTHRSAACTFKHKAWGVVQSSAGIVKMGTSYSSFLQSERDDASALSEQYLRLQSRYGYPNGSMTLYSALSDAWSQTYDAAYWDGVYADGGFSDDFAKQQSDQAMSNAQTAMFDAWWDIRAICRGG